MRKAKLADQILLGMQLYAAEQRIRLYAARQSKFARRCFEHEAVFFGMAAVPALVLGEGYEA